MSLLSRLTVPADGEAKIPVHQFMAAVAEYKRGAPGVTLASITAAFGLSGQEVTDLGTLAAIYVSDQITREMIHDVLMLGEAAIYDFNTCLARILTPGGTPNLSVVIAQAKADANRIGMNDFVLAGALVSPQGSPNMTLAVAKGAIMSNGALLAVTAGNVTIGAADSALSRIDVVVATSAGAKAVRAGTPAASPAIGGVQGGDVPLALVYVPPGTTSIGSSNMMDVRIVRSRGPLTIGQITTAVVKNNTNAQQLFIDLVIPSGLLLTGKMVRVRCGGTMLLNSGTPTARLQIAYGGTIMFDDVTTAATASAVRVAWALDVMLIARSNTSQVLNGCLELGPVASSRTAPTVGVGDILTPTVLAGSPVSAPLNGSAAVDSDAADRNFQLAWTMSVGNAADEIVMESATAEIM